MALVSASTYGNAYLRGRRLWVDREDNDIPALRGATNREPGIALRNRATLGDWFRIRDRTTGKTQEVRQTDYGGLRGVDINGTLANLFGYSLRNFPTGSRRFELTHLGKRRPSGTGMAPQAPGRAPTVRPEPAANSFWLGVHQNAAKGIPTRVPQGYNYGDVSPQVQQSLWTSQYRAQFAAQGGEQGFRQRELQRALKLRRGR